MIPLDLVFVEAAPDIGVGDLLDVRVDLAEVLLEDVDETLSPLFLVVLPVTRSVIGDKRQPVNQIALRDFEVSEVLPPVVDGLEDPRGFGPRFDDVREWVEVLNRRIEVGVELHRVLVIGVFRGRPPVSHGRTTSYSPAGVSRACRACTLPRGSTSVSFFPCQ